MGCRLTFSCQRTKLSFQDDMAERIVSTDSLTSILSPPVAPTTYGGGHLFTNRRYGWTRSNPRTSRLPHAVPTEESLFDSGAGNPLTSWVRQVEQSQRAASSRFATRKSASRTSARSSQSFRFFHPRLDAGGCRKYHDRCEPKIPRGRTVVIPHRISAGCQFRRP